MFNETLSISKVLLIKLSKFSEFNSISIKSFFHLSNNKNSFYLRYFYRLLFLKKC